MLATPKRRQLAISGAIIGAALLTSASIFATGPDASPTAPAEKAWPVSVTQALPQTLRPNFSAFGRLESSRVARLRSDLIAPILTVLAREGDWVERGDELVQLDDREAKLRVVERQAELREQQANLAGLRVQLDLEQQSAEHFTSRYSVVQAKLERHQGLMAKRLISKSLLDEVTAQANEASIEYRNHLQVLTNLPNQIAAYEANVMRAQAQLDQAQLDADKTVIRAPFSGPVLAVHVAPGDHSNLAAPLIELADASGFEVRVQIPEAYAQHFHNLAEPGIVAASTQAGVRLRLRRVTSHVRSGQTGVDAFFAFAPDAAQIPALGRVLNLSVELPAQADLVAVPAQSIYQNNRIYVVEDGRLRGHEIERAGELETAERGYEILIRSAELEAGDAIITTQLPRAITGLLVDVANAAEG
jgi:multidrug efflux pump subunit AcrA (membrane-fusion protein)